MVSVKTSGKTRILDSVLYPNREVQPQFMSYEIIPKGEEEGRVGLVANETASTIELLQAGGLTRLFAKDKVSRMDPTGCWPTCRCSRWPIFWNSWFGSENERARLIHLSPHPVDF